MSEILSCQRIISLMVFLSFMIHHMLRVNLSIAIVEMTKKNGSNTSEPYYNWSEEEKNDILGCFFWSYLITQIPGGRFAEIFGPKKVIGFSLLGASLLTIFTPFACQSNHYWLLSTRICLGLFMGSHWPGTPPIATKWISSDNTSIFFSHMTASALGAGLTLLFCGYIIAYLGWPSVFYITGSISLIWTLFWFYLIYDTPDVHPRISREEKQRLKNITYKVTDENGETKAPWKDILTSASVWAFIIANGCHTFTSLLFLNELPTYMYQVLSFNIKENGFLSSFPFLARYLGSVSSAYIADKVKKSERFSTTAIRKCLNTLLFLGVSLIILIQVFFGYDRTVSVVVFTSALGLTGLATPGIYINCLDLAPGYAGTLFGLSQVLVCMSGYISTKTVAFFTKNHQTFEQWRNVFWIVIGVNLFASVVFLVFGSGKQQSWSYKSNVTELEQLREKNENKN